MPAAAEYFDAMRAGEVCVSSLATLDFGLLPPSAQELARTIGLTATVALVENYGGLTLRIPRGATERGRALIDDMARLIGQPAADALVQRYAGTALTVPSCKLALLKARDAALFEDRRVLTAEGLSERALVQCLALRYHLTERYVWRLLKKPVPATPPAQEQASLL